MKKLRSLISALLLVPASVFAAAGQAQLRIGFVDPALPGLPPTHKAAALAFAQAQGEVSRLAWQKAGGWLAQDGRTRAPEEFDLVWFHQGDDSAAAELDAAAGADLRAWLEGGGSLLLSGAAGRVLNDLDIEKTPLRVLGPSEVAHASGIRVLDKHRTHPAFAGLDTAKPVLLTSRGCNALADFYGTAGPTGELLANGNGPGERPLVEYRVGDGRVLFAGWRLADFTTAADAHRPNLERLFGNLLRDLASQNQNRARLIAPPGKSRYERRQGVPFLLADKPIELSATVTGEKTAVSVEADVKETAISGERVTVKALGLTLTQREKPFAQFVAQRRAEQDAVDRRDAELLKDVRVEKPAVKFVPAPLKPLQIPRSDQSVLLGRSAFQAPGEGRGDNTPVYEPVEDGGFRLTDGKRSYNRLIAQGQNRVYTGDLPVFRMDASGGIGVHSGLEDKVFPLWPRPEGHRGEVQPCMGRLCLGVPGPDGQPIWFHQMPGLKVTTTFRPGYTEYEFRGTQWNATLCMAPALDFHGLICRVEFDREVPLVWRYGGVYWRGNEANSNRVEIAGQQARITEANLPNGLVLGGWDGQGEGQAVSGLAQFTAKKQQRIYHVVAAWGVTAYDEARARATMARLDTPNAAAWPEARDRLKRDWFDAYIGRALEPEKHFRQLMAAPEKELSRTCEWWDRRRAEFQVRTPDPHLNALLNWERCRSEYHRQGPGLVLSPSRWEMAYHISVGWYGKEWAGDHDAVADCLRLYAVMQGDDGAILGIGPSLTSWPGETTSHYWVDHVWRHFTWTADRQFIRDLWPAVDKAVAQMLRDKDPDGVGLFQDHYEYWNCESGNFGKGPKGAAPSAMNWAMLDRAAQMAAIVGDTVAKAKYRDLADKTRAAVFRELWRDKEGRLGSIGADGLWRGHGQTWEQYLAANAGLLSPGQARSAMRWIESHYGFEPNPGVRLLSISDSWPIVWSSQWVPVGDTLLAALAGLRAGDADLWWPYIRTVVGSAFRNDFPGIGFGISNRGASGSPGDREDIDAVDPHTHVTVRGLFGIEPALHEGRLEICPAFPSDWREASIRTPDISYDWRRNGLQATFRIRTPKPVVKHVRANLTGKTVVTPRETESVVTVDWGRPLSPTEPPPQPTVLAEQQPLLPPVPLTESERGQQVLFDLAAACNVTCEGMLATAFISDAPFPGRDKPMPLKSRHHTPSLVMPPSPRLIETPAGWRFLTSGREGTTPAKNLLALSSWRPYPFPAGAVIPIGMRCQKLSLLLQNYVHPLKNYIPNGEVILNYADGRRTIEALIPPYNLDCYYQPFARAGEAVTFGQITGHILPWAFPSGMVKANANALQIACDPARKLESVEIRATCSEGVIGVAGLTVITPPN